MKRLLKVKGKKLFLDSNRKLTERWEQAREFANSYEAITFAGDLKETLQFYYSFADERCPDFDFAVDFGDESGKTRIVMALSTETASQNDQAA